jgi:anaerobic magnesium-protoporphyrin IX monomethyl ester cyclase
MKVCLVNPPLVTRRGLYYVPLGLSYLAAVLREHGYDVCILDSQLQKREDILKSAGRADVVGITSMACNFPGAVALARDIRKISPSAKIVMGGNFTTFTDVETLQENPCIDFVVRHEGEATFLEVLNALSKKGGFENLSPVRGITYREGDTIKRNPEKAFIDNLDSIPFPARDLLDAQRYYNEGGMPQIISSRGCPHQCIFCSTSSMWGHRTRLRSSGNIVDEIEQLSQQYTFEELNFADDTFTLIRKHVIGICEEMRERGLDISWGCNVRADTLNEKLIQIMKKAGCGAFFLGVESGNQKTLDFMRKKITISQIKRAVKLSKKHSIKTALSCILGFPNETYEDVQNTIDFMISLKGDSYLFNFLLVFPGTELYRQQDELKIKKIVDNPWERIEKTPFPIPVVEIEKISLDELCQLYLDAKGKLELLKKNEVKL